MLAKEFIGHCWYLNGEDNLDSDVLKVTKRKRKENNEKIRRDNSQSI